MRHRWWMPSAYSAAAAPADQRRPTGDPPPLPRRVESTGIGWLIGAAVLVAATIAVFRNGLRGPAMAVTVADDAVVGGLAQLRPEFTLVLRAIAAGIVVDTLTLSTPQLLALLILRRFRHLLVLLLVQSTTGSLVALLTRSCSGRGRSVSTLWVVGVAGPRRRCRWHCSRWR